jgi:predicted GTPase
VGTASGNKGPPQVDVASGDFFTVGERFSELAAEESAARAEEEDEEGGGLGEEQGAAAGTALRARDSRALYKSLRYGVVAILGSQSSGKSTLLNALFGTQFPVLDPAATGIKVMVGQT